MAECLQLAIVERLVHLLDPVVIDCVEFEKEGLLGVAASEKLRLVVLPDVTCFSGRSEERRQG